MTPEEFEAERKKSAAALEGAVAGAREGSAARTPEQVLGPALPRKAEAPASRAEAPESAAWNPPAPPDLKPVNDSLHPTMAKGSSSLLERVNGREAARQAQAKFNADQVQLDNTIVTWTAAHFEATHRHYDAVIERMQKRMDEIDTRHRELERELVRHVHDMARRIDVVLGEGEKARVSHEAALRSLRERLRELEEKLR